MRSRLCLALVSGFVLAATAPLAGQSRAATLRVSVVDQTRAAIVGATVRLEAAGAAPLELATDNRGRVVAADLTPGQVRLRVESPGFAPHEDVLTLRRGNNSETVMLRLAAIEEELTVTERDAGDRRGNSFSTTLNEDDLAGLPDDPDDFEDALRQMAGGDAVFNVNGFQGGRLPPKNQIRQVRFRMNSFAAENHDAGRVHIDIITKPGLTAWSGNANLGLRDDVLNARNAFARTATPEQFRRFSGNLSGPLQKDRTSLFFSVEGNMSYDSQTIVAQTPAGLVADQVRRPIDRAEVTAGLEHALTANQTLRLEYQRLTDTRRNLGVGDFALQERAYTRETELHQFRGSANSVLGKSAFNELRVELKIEDTLQRSASSDPAVVVIDAFKRGGAGVASDRALTSLDVRNDTDFTVGRHAFRTGVLLEAGAYEQLDARNANGTFTFGSVDAFLAGRPNTYTQRLGEVETAFSRYQVGLYFQDDFRVNKNLALSLGVREELQNHLDDASNLMPRVGFTWNPFGSKTTIRGGYGLFHAWFGADLYDQALRVNGVAQRDLLVLDPGYPDPFAGTTANVLPGGRVQIAPDLQMPLQHQASIGVERTLWNALGVQVMFARLDGRHQLRSIDVNAPDANGVRPEPGVGTITEITSTGRSEMRRLFVNANFRLPERRTMIGMHYILASDRNHADNPLSLPADSGNPDAEWGPSADDARHRFFGMFNTPLPKGLRVNVMLRGQSGLPYTITTGRDDNGDGVNNDRPAGVGRNTERGTWRWDLNLRLSRGFGFGGQRQTDGGPVITRRTGGDGGGPVMMTVERSDDRYRVEFYVQAYNLFNRTNYVNYSGNQQSPFFGLPSSATAARRLEVGMQFGF